MTTTQVVINPTTPTIQDIQTHQFTLPDHTQLPDSDGNLTFALIKNLVYANVTIMDEYLPEIINIIENKQTPEIAIKQIENVPE